MERLPRQKERAWLRLAIRGCLLAEAEGLVWRDSRECFVFSFTLDASVVPVPLPFIQNRRRRVTQPSPARDKELPCQPIRPIFF